MRTLVIPRLLHDEAECSLPALADGIPPKRGVTESEEATVVCGLWSVSSASSSC